MVYCTLRLLHLSQIWHFGKDATGKLLARLRDTGFVSSHVHYHETWREPGESTTSSNLHLASESGQRNLTAIFALEERMQIVRYVTLVSSCYIGNIRGHTERARSFMGNLTTFFAAMSGQRRYPERGEAVYVQDG